MQNTSIADIRSMLAEAAGEDLAALIKVLTGDGRSGVAEAVGRATRRLEREGAEHARLCALAAREWELADRGLQAVAGVDEVGRGALAGPVTAGACIFPRDAMLRGIDDSKRLSRAARERLDEDIRAVAIRVSVAHAGPDEIDALGIVAATVLAMRRALAGLGVPVDHVLVDGHPVNLGVPSTAIVRGDSLVRAIAAAAICAKVSRDALMRELDPLYPEYGFVGNKGYGSADHLAVLAQRGPSPVHRLSFAPCSNDTLF